LERFWKMAFEPLEGFLKAGALQVDDQIDGAPSPRTLGPVHELGASDGKSALGGVPFMAIRAVGLCTAKPENGRQGHGPQPIGAIGA